MKKGFFLLLVLAASVMAGAQEVGLYGHEKGIWSINDSHSVERWIVIHNLQQAKEDGIFHIQILGREKKSGTGNVEVLVPHMAITQDALEKSVIMPLGSGAMSEKSFRQAFRKWKKAQAKGKARVCSTMVATCLHNNR